MVCVQYLYSVSSLVSRRALEKNFRKWKESQQRDIMRGKGGGRGAKLNESEKAWLFINNSVLSGLKSTYCIVRALYMMSDEFYSVRYVKSWS